MATVGNANDICVICSKPDIRSYPLRKCSTCENLLHRRCANKPFIQVILCNTCLSTKVSRRSGNISTPPLNTCTRDSSLEKPVCHRATPPINSTLTSVVTSSSKNTLKQSNDTNRPLAHNNVDKTCDCSEKINNLLDSWEIILQTQFDKQLDIIQKIINENYSSIRNEIAALNHNIHNINNPTVISSPSTTKHAGEATKLVSESIGDSAAHSDNQQLSIKSLHYPHSFNNNELSKNFSICINFLK